MSRPIPLPLPSLTRPAAPAASVPAPPEGESKSADMFRKQRDEARQQREIARQQREEMRRQRDELRARVDLLEAQVTQAAAAGLDVKVPPARDVAELDLFALEAERSRQLPEIRAKRDRGLPLSIREAALLGERLVPPKLRLVPSRAAPGPDIAFLTVANAAFTAGVEALLLSLLRVYPGFGCTVHICHDGTLNRFVQARLRSLYPNLVFIEPDMAWFDSVPSISDNHKRIGKLGYMNMEGLALTGFSRVILLDSDVLVTGDISELWQGDSYAVCYDCGDREYVSRSEVTGDWVFNSGMISIPGHMTGPAAYAEFREMVKTYAAAEVCPVIDRFADQKIWNLFLRDKPKTFLPINYNCNIKYLAKFLNGQTEGISLLHFAGPKPWNSKQYVASEHIQPVKSRALTYPKPWLDAYREAMFRTRGQAYLAHAAAHRRRRPVLDGSLIRGRRTCLMIGNGPSLAQTDLSVAEGVEKFAFNWFILSDAFDTMRPQHLVLGSHMLFGGWATTDPRFPEGYLERLRAHRHRPVLWTSFYFREYLEDIGLHREFEINYGLFEKPFKRFIDRVGRYNADIDSFLDDGRTGVISLGIPAALSMGFERILLVGCDSNYNQPGTESKYFYDMAQHTSAETRESSLTETWTEEGRGHFVYKVVAEDLERRGVEFLDCTVGGALRTVPKATLAEVLVPGHGEPGR